MIRELIRWPYTTARTVIELPRAMERSIREANELMEVSREQLDVMRRQADQALDQAERVVIAGGGYIGLEVAATVRYEERAATVLEAEERVMKRVTSPVISEFVEKFHRGRGVDIDRRFKEIPVE